MSENVYFIIFNIENKQDHYARCMEFIKAIESPDDGNLKEYKEGVKARFLHERVRRGRAVNDGRDTFDTWIKKIEKALPNARPVNIDNLIDNLGGRQFVYYFRIEMADKSDVADFFFHTLMLHAPWMPKERILSCFHTQDGSDIYRFSHIIHLLPDESKNFYIYHNNEVYKPDKSGKSHVMLPIIEINQSTYEELAKKRKIRLTEVSKADPESMLELEIARLEFESGEERASAVMRHANVLITRGGGHLVSGYKQEDRRVKARTIANAAVSAINKENGISALHYLFFAVLLRNCIENSENSTEKEWERSVSECYAESLGFADGITQVLENIVFHTKNKKGLFVARLHDVGEHLEYLSETGARFTGENNKYRHLQLIVADFNEFDNIIENFLEKNKKIAGDLNENKNSLRLADFLNEYEFGGAKEQWLAFRIANPAKCQGLLKFSQAGEENGAVICARSSVKFEDKSERDIWKRDFRGRARDVEVPYSGEDAYIPGTQFGIIFPVTSKKARTRYPIESALKTTFEAYAKFLNYSEADISSKPMAESFKGLSPDNISQDKKWLMWQEAVKCWNEMLCKALAEGKLKRKGKKPLFIIDMGDFCEAAAGANVSWFEPLSKGFIDSKWLSNDEPVYIAFTKYCTKFAETFRTTAGLARKLLFRDELREDKSQMYFQNGLWNDGVPDILSGNADVTEATTGASDIGGRKFAATERVPWECFNILNAGSEVVERLQNYADNDLYENGGKNGFGCKLSNTHVKLGSKVHIDTFYEMASHFTKQEVSKDAAFYLLRRLLANKDFERLLNSERKIYLYGYAAYSQTILNALYEMLSIYVTKNNYPAKISFIIYQTSQPGETMDYEEQVYISDADTANDADSKLAIVQIVPISSTLTTFKKMWNKLHSMGKIKNMPDNPAHNITVLWVRDDFKNGFGSPTEPSDHEKAYWEKCDDKNMIITTNDDIIQNPMYVLAVPSKWRDPLTCEKCYHDDAIGLEYPLIKTDDSSTVPTQQYYKAWAVLKNNPDTDDNKDYTEAEIASARNIARLEGTIKYGHVCRASNHFQFYIDMQKYFRANKGLVIDWLKKLSEKYDSSKDMLIVSPQKANNIEFSQCVNNHCFNGKARILYLDSEKHFRSNLKLDFAQYIEDLKGDEFEYIFVDTSISTGQTFARIASLMNTIAPESRNPFVFNSVILLVNRLSSDSQKTYVHNTESEFHSFAHLNISNMRTYGDSCVGCKICNEARLYYMTAATKQMSEYWQGKILKNDVVFHEKWCPDQDSENNADGEMSVKLRAKGFIRMLCAHTAMNRLHSVRGRKDGDYVKALQDLLDEGFRISNSTNWTIGEESKSSFDYCDMLPMQKDAGENVLESYIKTLCRPFFSYDIKIKNCLSDILMLFVMIVLEDFDAAKAVDGLRGKKPESKAAFAGKAAFAKSEWRENAANELRILLSDKEEKTKFLLVLLKALAIMQMNFIYRKEVIIKINSFLTKNEQPLGKFYEKYSQFIMRTIDCGGDESKGYRLEFLLRTCEDFSSQLPDDNITVSEIGGDVLCDKFGLEGKDEKTRQDFKAVRDFLIVENNHILLNGLRSFHKDINNFKGDNRLMMRQSHMWDFARFLLLERTDKVVISGENSGKTVAEEHGGWLEHNKSLYEMLVNDMIPQNKTVVNNKKEDCANCSVDRYQERYDKLRDLLSNITRIHFDKCVLSLASRYRSRGAGCKQTNCEKMSKRGDYLQMLRDNLFLIVPTFDSDTNNMEMIKKMEEEIKEAEEGEGTLQTYGYHVGNGHIFIKFENNHNYMKEELSAFTHTVENNGHNVPRMEPVYLFIESGGIKCGDYKALALVRNIMMYRYFLIAWFEKDFNNDTMASIAWYSRTAMLLTAQKAGDHQFIDDIDSIQRELSYEPWPEDMDEKQSIEDNSSNLFKIHTELRGGFASRKYLMMLHLYVNLKIARMFRTMLGCEVLRKGLNYKDLYRAEVDNSDNLYGKQKLLSLSEALTCADKEHVVNITKIDKQKMDFDLLGLSRKWWLDVMLEVLDISLISPDGFTVTVSSMDEIKSGASGFKFLQFEFDNETYGYCSEHFACFLFDFFFSAMKYSIDWDKVKWKYRHYRSGPAERFRYFLNYKLKCKINIRRENGERRVGGKHFDWLVLEAASVKKSDAEVLDGMSVPSMRWYFDGLWKIYAEKNGIDYETIPKSKKSLENSMFKLSLPILKPKD